MLVCVHSLLALFQKGLGAVGEYKKGEEGKGKK